MTTTNTPTTDRTESDELLESMPHRPPMRLISQVISASEQKAVCRIIVGDNNIPGFDETPIHWSIGIEDMAQSTALVRGASSANRRSGMVVSVREVHCGQAGFIKGEALDATATLDSRTLEAALFRCALVRTLTGETLMSAKIAVACRQESGSSAR